ncbi:MAG: M3 family metallopeptidase [Akkermansia sp.]
MNHPFLNPTYLVSWSTLTPDAVKGDLEQAIAEAQANIDAICDLSQEALSYERTFGALESASDSLNLGWGRLMHLDSVMDDAPQRDAIAEMMPAVVSFSSSVPLNSQLWEVLKSAAKCPWVQELSPAKRRFIQETMADFKESGADLSEEQKERFAEIESELSLLTKKFAENVLDSTNAWELIVTDESELSGLPESCRDAARQEALAKGYGSESAPQWRFTLQYTSMAPVLQFADSDDLRRRIWQGSNTVGSGKFDNAELIAKILKLREEKARMLGFGCFADYTTSRRMAETGGNALDFINGLHDRVRPAFVGDMNAVLAYKNEKLGTISDRLSPWEVSYWSEKRRQELYDFNEEDLRPYYSVAKVMKGMFDIYSHLYGITVTQRPTFYVDEMKGATPPAGAVEVWHPDVLFYEIHDVESGEHLGSFYADWHPRDSKRSGAWMNSLSTGVPAQNGKARIPHIGLMVGNMTKPVGDKPALLVHREVETIFHEFGHLLHQLLSDTEVKSLAGTNVAWDFVELPSQINENWCWERESVNMYAAHYETGETIPDQLFDKMRAARNYMSGTDFMRQLTFGKMDLELHVHFDQYKGRDLEEIDEEILKDYRVPMTTKGPSVARRMTHLFSAPTGYAAGYYSYKWAEVLEADAFSRFLKEGVLNEKTGRDFRRCILSKGNSKPAAELYRDFMGRNPDSEALLIKTGIQANN